MIQELYLFENILKRKERKAQLNNNKKRLKFVFRSILAFNSMIKLGNFILTHKYLKDKVHSYPILISKIHRPYLTKNMKRKDKLKAILNSYNVIDRFFNKDILEKLYLEKRTILATINGKDESTYFLSLELYPNYDKEGELCLRFLDVNENILASVTFSFLNSSNENLVLLIGGIQGAHKDIDKEYIKKVTKDIYGIFPKKILIEALYMIEKSLNLNIEKFSVGNEMHVYRAQRYIRKRQILSDYDSFLISLGAEKNKKNIWKLPPYLQKKDLDTVPSKKRSQYLKKTTLTEDIQNQIHKNINNTNNL